jgi:preprotein translocase subunit YajC
LFFASTAFAMGPQQGGAAAQDGTAMLLNFLPLILMFAIFWFLLIRPQQKRAKAHKQMLAELTRGDYVMTSSGIFGRIIEINDEQVVLESETAKIRFSRSAIGALVTPPKGKGKDKDKDRDSDKDLDKDKK